MNIRVEPDLIDPSLPQLAAALDPSSMRMHLAGLAQLQHEEKLSNVIVEHARLRPGKCCVLGYRLSICSSISALTRDVQLTARLYPPGESASRYAGACARLSAHDRIKRAPAHLAELGMLVWAFPQERKLKSLDVIGSPERVRKELLPQLPGFAGMCGLSGQSGLRGSAGSDPAQADISIVHYVPEHGCTVRVSTAGCTMYAKHYLPGESNRAHQILAELKNALGHQNPELRTPTPLMHMVEIDVLWVEGLPGDTLMDCLNRHSISREDWERIAIAVSRLHGTCLNSARPIARGAIVERLERVASASEILTGGQTNSSTEKSTSGATDCLTKAQSRRIRILVDRLKERAALIDFAQQVTLHGDLHPKNILLDEQGACLIDLDAVTLGPACLDLGSLCAALMYQALLSEQDAARTHQSLNNIIQAYRQRASVNSGDLAWATAVALISERCYRCLTRLKPGRVSLIEKLLDSAEQILTRNSCTPTAQLRRPDARSGAGADSDGGSQNRSFANWQDLRQMRQRLNETILPALASNSGVVHAAVLDCEVVEARYHRYLNPASVGKSSMSIGYRLSMFNGQVEWVYVRAYRDARSRSCFEQRPDPNDNAVHLPELDAVVWRFPDDPSLPQLRELLDPVQTRRLLPWPAAPIETELVKYRPGHRCAFQYRLAGDPQHNPIGFAKTFSDQRGRLLHARLRQLALHCNGRLAEGVCMPQVLSYQERLNTVWFDYTPGRPLEHAADVIDNPALIERMGAALAKLHSSTLQQAATITPAALLKDATKKVAKICSEHADLQPRLHYALVLLTEWAARLPTPQSASLHGDWHLGQWLQHRDQLTLVDFDEMICGDPALDLSNFVVDLAVRGASDDSVEQISELLLSAYERYSARIGRYLKIHRCWYHWHLLVHWFNRAYRLFLQQRPGLARSLAEVVARLDVACRRLQTLPMGASA